MNGDLELLERLRQRSQQGLEEAIHKYAGYVAAVVRKTLGSFGRVEDTEELVSDVFVALWQRADSLRDDSSLKNWMAVVARNAALKRLSRTQLEEPLEENLLPDFALSDTSTGQTESRLVVRQAVDSLGGQDREIFLRHYFWYESVGQIARELDMNPATVKTRLKRGRDKLREKLEKEECA